MQTFEVVNNGMVYEARKLVEGGGGLEDVVVLSATMKVLSPLTVRQGLDGPVLATMDHNLAQTVFECHDGSGAKIAELSFAWFTITPGFTLKMGTKEYKVEEREPSHFSCIDESGTKLMVIDADKHFFSADRWRVSFADEFPAPLALLSVVALKQRRA